MYDLAHIISQRWLHRQLSPIRYQLLKKHTIAFDWVYCFRKCLFSVFQKKFFFLCCETQQLKQNEDSASCNNQFADCLAQKTGANMNEQTCSREVVQTDLQKIVFYESKFEIDVIPYFWFYLCIHHYLCINEF